MRSAFPLSLLTACLAGCSLGSIGQTLDAGLSAFQQAEATHAVAVTLLQSPSVPGLDGGAVAGLSVFFGSRAAGDTASAPTGLPGATVSVSDSAGLATTCQDQGNGEYTATTLDGGLRYDATATYTFTLVLDGGTYVAGGTAPPPEVVPAFQAALPTDGGLPSVATIPVDQAYTLQRAPPPAGQSLPVALVTVNAITGGHPSATPTWTNAPQTPLAMFQLVVDDSAYRAPTIAIPGSAFPTAGEYLVTLTAVAEGGPKSQNLFLGSAVLIGSGSAGVFAAR